MPADHKRRRAVVEGDIPDLPAPVIEPRRDLGTSFRDPVRRPGARMPIDRQEVVSLSDIECLFLILGDQERLDHLSFVEGWDGEYSRRAEDSCQDVETHRVEDGGMRRTCWGLKSRSSVRGFFSPRAMFNVRPALLGWTDIVEFGRAAPILSSFFFRRREVLPSDIRSRSADVCPSS